MFTRTDWRISTWDAASVGGTIIIGVSVGAVTVVLRHGRQSHQLTCYGVGGGLGIGLNSFRNITIPSVGFDPSVRVEGGTIYKNDLMVSGNLTLDNMSSWIVAQGAELSVLDEGQAGYLVLFADSLGSFAPLLAGGGLLTGAAALVGCNALTFISVDQEGLPNAALAGYRYRVDGVA